MINIETLTEVMFKSFPLVTEGESKEVRYVGQGKVVIRFKPTVYSFTHNRYGIVHETDTQRLKACIPFLEVTRKAGVKHAYHEINHQWVLADLILPPIMKNNEKSFEPRDLSQEQIAKLPRATPLEVVIKGYHTGTPKHRYYEFSQYQVRESSSLKQKNFEIEESYPEQIVRFDWRNPLKDAHGKNLADEVMPDSMANWFINVEKARATALTVFRALNEYLAPRDLICCDLCLIIAEDGETVFGEISPDCGRFRHGRLGSMDKDIWRSGGSSDTVVEKWDLLLKAISA